MRAPNIHTLHSITSSLLIYGRAPPRLFLTRPQKRAFIPNPSELLSSISSTLSAPPLRHLTHTTALTFPPSLVFRAIASVDQYPQFLPFVLSARITEKDSANWPAKATLRVGYEKFGLEEDWESVVRCDESQGVVEARSDDSVQKHASQGLFDVLKTRWQVGQKQEQTLVKLDVELKLRNAVYDRMFAQVESKVARTMIKAFEKRVEELEKGNVG